VIWFLLISTALISALFLFAPLTKKGDGLGRNAALIAAFFMILSSIGLYSWKGHPELTGKNANLVQAQSLYSQGLISQSVEAYEGLIALYPEDKALKEEFDTVITELSRIPKEQLQIIQTVAELKQRLETSPSADPKEWRLLANSQMQLGNYEGALKSYERLVQIAPDNAAYRAEYEKARNFISAEKQAQSMSEEDRQAMIKNMVEGLAARLYQEGGTPEEWARLIRSRKQLGQDTLLAEDIDRVKNQFRDRPDILTQILGE